MKFHFQIPTFFTILLLGASSMTPNTVAALRGTSKSHKSEKTKDGNRLILDIDCTSPFGGTCDSLPQYTSQCQERPSEMTFLYTGGDCSGSFNIQPNDIFQCEDFQGGPSSQDGTLSYIQAVAPSNEEVVYFSGFVIVGDQFTLSSPEVGGLVGMNMNVTIYNPGNLTDPSAIVQEENMIQSFQFQTSCSPSNLFLMDKFGGIQLYQFVNQAQGTVARFYDVTLGFNIDVPNSDSDDEAGKIATLSALSVISNIDDFNMILNDRVAGRLILPGVPVYVTEQLRIDLLTRQTYTIVGTVLGKSTIEEGIFYPGWKVFEFTAGGTSP